MSTKQKLELDWVGKERRPRLEPRILMEDVNLSYHAEKKVSEHDIFDNQLVFGDNLLALKALERDLAGQVKCIFIDPPYNTHSAIPQYDDGLEHSTWLGLMRDRLEILHRLLREDGSIWITIDDNESHYLKVLCDEIFGRSNFIANVVWEKTYTPKSNGRGLSADHDHILVFAKSAKWYDTGWNYLPRSGEQLARYSNPDDDPRGPWRTFPLDVRTEDEERRAKYRYEIKLPSGRIVKPARGRHWSLPEEKFYEELEAGRIFFGKDGNAMPTKKAYVREGRTGVIARTWWSHEEAGHNQEAKRELLALMPEGVSFITPKPERLIHRILTLATNPGDLVLDSFAGSGTTGAVAHKMGRRWVMIELHDHCETLIVPRLRKVISGEDAGGVTSMCEWKGGGGFRYFKLESMFSAGLDSMFSAGSAAQPTDASTTAPFALDTPEKRNVANIVLDVVKQFERLESSERLQEPEIRKQIEAKVKEILAPAQMSIPGVETGPDVTAIVNVVTKTYAEYTIDVPKISVIATSEVTFG